MNTAPYASPTKQLLSGVALGPALQVGKVRYRAAEALGAATPAIRPKITSTTAQRRLAEVAKLVGPRASRYRCPSSSGCRGQPAAAFTGASSLGRGHLSSDGAARTARCRAQVALVWAPSQKDEGSMEWPRSWTENRWRTSCPASHLGIQDPALRFACARGRGLGSSRDRRGKGPLVVVFAGAKGE